VHAADTVGLAVEMRVTVAALLAVAVLLAFAAVAAALPAFDTAPRSSPGSGTTQAQASAVTAACHARFDRFVVRLAGGTPGYDVRYVRRVRSDGSGAVVPLVGKRRVRVLLRNARAHTASGAATLPHVLTPRCPGLRQVKLAGDFEGVVTFGLGVARPTGFRVFRLTGPARVVVDVRH
jgi:hypothetical protein